MATTMDSVTREQVEQLAREAGEAGDQEQVALCRLALRAFIAPCRYRHLSALQACVRAIQAAEAMVDSCPLCPDGTHGPGYSCHEAR